MFFLSSKRGNVMEALLSSFMGAAMIFFMALPWILIVAVPLALLAGFIASPLIYFLWKMYRSLQVTRPWKILVADDDRVSIAPLLAALKNRAVEVQFVEDGKEVINALRRQKFDLVFLDMMMPGLNGDRVLKVGERLLENKTTTPVIFYTGNYNNARGMLDKEFHRFQVNDVWEKSMPFAMLGQRLDKMFPKVPITA